MAECGECVLQVLKAIAQVGAKGEKDLRVVDR